MRNLHNEHPEIYQESMKRNFVVKTKPSSFNAIFPDIRLWQTIKKVKKKEWRRYYWSDEKSFICGGMEALILLAIRNAYHDMTSGRISFSERGHPLSTYAKFFEKLIFLTPWYVCIRGLEMLVFREIVRTYLMDGPKQNFITSLVELT